MASTRPNVFVDVNIFVDISEMRQGWNNSFEVITGIRKEKYNGYISAFTVPILYFRRIRIEPDKEARTNVWKLINGHHIIELTESVLEQAKQDVRFRDYEDAIQYYSAKTKCDVIVTRNKKDFPHRDIKVMNPEDFLNSYR
jgi:predicted nucleic acid-binding protein